MLVQTFCAKSWISMMFLLRLQLFSFVCNSIFFYPHIFLNCSGGEVVDLYLKSAIEGVIIKWATQINDILTEDSTQAFANGQNPTPTAGICFFIRNIILKRLILITKNYIFSRYRK